MTQALSWDEWAGQDGTALAALARAGEVSPQELASQAAEAIGKVNPALSGVIELFDDAIAAPESETHLRGPFAGLPFLMKDLGPTMKGRRQEMGSRLMRGNRAGEDTFLTQQMRKAGLNLIGRTTTPEFGVCSSAENPAVYITRNPWNTDYTTCGSSAGSAAMVASGAVPMAHATDGGGSIRIPAGVNGLIGLKPSRGVFSLAPHMSDLTGLVSAQGCLTRSVRDTAAFVDACRGGAPGEFMPYWSAPQPYTELIRRDPPRLRIALADGWGDFKATPHIAAELARAGRFLESLGHQVEIAQPEIDYRAAFEAQTLCYISNFAVVIGNMLAARGLDRPPEDLIEPVNIRIWEMGRDISFAERARMQAVFNATARGFGVFYRHHDVLLTPITALPTPKIGTREYLTISDNPSVLDWFGHLWRNFAFTPLDNLCGVPALSMPLAQHDNGLPLGIQAHARQTGDGLLLQLAAQIERALGGDWHGGRRPPVHVTA
jgi:Asp-tRNA(Asn)/Glu-tRNA(Gln) amidotransferase A subunit family amidase